MSLEPAEETRIREALLREYRAERQVLSDQMRVLGQRMTALDSAIKALEGIQALKVQPQPSGGNPGGIGANAGDWQIYSFKDGSGDKSDEVRVVERKPGRREGPSLRGRLEEIFSDGETRSVEQVIAELKARWPEKDDKRVSVTNRLNDLMHANRLVSPQRAYYRLATPGDRRGDTGQPELAADSNSNGAVASPGDVRSELDQLAPPSRSY